MLIHQRLPSCISSIPPVSPDNVAVGPTVDLLIGPDTPRAEARDNPVGDAIGEVNGKMVGVMLLQSQGYLTCLEVYDLSDIEHPYGPPGLSSLKPFNLP